MTITHRVMHDLGCPCGRHFRRALYHALDVTQQPGLRYAVLAQVVNVVQCPSCERMARVSLPFLYQDAARGHFIYVCPEEAEEQQGLLRGQLGQLMSALKERAGPLEDLQSPTLMFGLERLAQLVRAELSDGEQPGSLSFDVRPSIKAERAARALAGRVALQINGYVHSWREGGRLHLRILGPRTGLEEATLSKH
jgi:hypothetical protein